jgi:chemotaxis protein MotB
MGVLILGTLCFVLLYFVPLYRENSVLRTKQGETQTKLAHTEEDLQAIQTELERINYRHDELAAKLSREVVEKEEALKEKEEVLREKEEIAQALQDAQTKLESSLSHELEEGEVLVVRRHGRLVLDVSDKVLFARGETDVSERGQGVLRQVAETLNRIGGYDFIEAGHTDNSRVVSADLVERFPTNWELSTARATNVVRFLQDECEVDGRRLVAAGYAEHRPVARNWTRYGQQRNRRIEIVLIPTGSESTQ